MSSQNRLFRFQLFSLPNSTALRSIGVYISGGLYAVGFWAFIDSVIYSKTVNASDVHISFVDWIPIICSSLGMLTINSLEKNKLLNDALNGGSGSFNLGGDPSAWSARVVLFLGFALLAGGLAGSIAVLILKFVIKHYEFPTLGMGVANVVSNGSIMLSCIVLWIAQNIEDEYSYSLAL
ncbi:hypothetical protein WICMUC_001596 [Wickerhamomyces mucosus]|uniref:Vacuolar protein sorting-associated protein 68 n=1 Tax=Wickerhamomyces mucosus TaxID=1378264 RepID=A0A9P8PVF0_9ASCO|nr:hypothetical protein WICMUC_001596 [Wickerhamomyces mucosus]